MLTPPYVFNQIGREKFLGSRMDPPVFCLRSGPSTFNGLCVFTSQRVNKVNRVVDSEVYKPTTL